MKGPKAVELRAIDVLDMWNRFALTYKGENKKAAKRVVYAIEDLPNFDVVEIMTQQGERQFPRFVWGKDEAKETIFLPLSKVDRIFVWDEIKKDIPRLTIAEERVVGRVAQALGKHEDFLALIEDTEPSEEDGEKEEE